MINEMSRVGSGLFHHFNEIKMINEMSRVGSGLKMKGIVLAFLLGIAQVKKYLKNI